MTPAEAVAAIERLVEAGEHYIAVSEANPTEWPGGSTAWMIDDLNSYEPLAEAARAARPALSALAGMCVLDVEVVRVLVKLARMVAMMSRETAALAAAEAELRRVEPLSAPS